MAQTSCRPTPQGPVEAPVQAGGIVPLDGEVEMEGKVLHPSHSLQHRGQYNLYFCGHCGKTASLDPRHLVQACTGETKKGRQNLARIRKGLYPHPGGPPETILAARAAQAGMEATQHGVGGE